MENKTCMKCGVDKPVTEFWPPGKSHNTHKYCKDCFRSWGREYYKRHRGKLLLKSRTRYTATREYLRQAKNKPCMDCGIEYPFYCMDFDHRPGEVKLFAPKDGANRSLDSAIAEIAKCDVVCSNCHRIRTYTRNNQS